MIWYCSKCGFAGSKGAGVPMDEHEFPVHCVCGLVESFIEASLRIGSKQKNAVVCVHRSQTSVEIDLRSHSCGCGTYSLYECSLFSELTTFMPVLKEKAVTSVTAKHPTFRGRNCYKCPVREC
jgi:hypothetical protein